MCHQWHQRSSALENRSEDDSEWILGASNSPCLAQLAYRAYTGLHSYTKHRHGHLLLTASCGLGFRVQGLGWLRGYTATYYYIHSRIAGHQISKQLRQVRASDPCRLKAAYCCC